MTIHWFPDKSDGGTMLAYIRGDEVGWISDHGGRVIWWVRGPTSKGYTAEETARRVQIRRLESFGSHVASVSERVRKRFWSAGGEVDYASEAKRRVEHAAAALYARF